MKAHTIILAIPREQMLDILGIRGDVHLASINPVVFNDSIDCVEFRIRGAGVPAYERNEDDPPRKVWLNEIRDSIGSCWAKLFQVGQ
jgi:hypothetical protein